MNQNKYKDYTLAHKLRASVSKAISSFFSSSHLFTPEELRVLLVKLFKLKQYQVSYELLKILFYGKSKYQHVTSLELVNYIFEKHLGQNALNTFSIRQGNPHKADKLLTKSQFVKIINIGLEFLNERKAEEDEEELKKLYDQIDQKNLEIISQEEYQMFLKEYFGSESSVNTNFGCAPDKVAESIELIPLSKISQKNDFTPLKAGTGQLFESKYLSEVSKTSPRLVEHLQPLEEFKQLAQTQIKIRCLEFDSDGNEQLTKNETYQFFYHVLQLQQNSIEYILENYFDFQENPLVGTTQLIEVISEVHFREVFSMLLKQELKNESPNQCLMSCEYFIKKIIQNCFFFKKKPDQDLLKAVFKELEVRSDSKKNGFITLEDFRSYVLTALCNNHLIFRKYSKKNTHNALLNIPLSIAEVENSNFQEDSEHGEIKPRQFTSSICEPYNSKKLLEDHGEQINGNISNSNNREDIRYGQQSSKDNIPKEFSMADNNHQLAFTNVQRKKGSVLTKNKSNLKEVLWSKLQKMLKKYSNSKEDVINERQVLILLENESFFSDLALKDSLLKYFSRSYEISHHLLIKYIIHKSGEHSLIKHNKEAIKGKSMLTQSQVYDLLYSAYGAISDVSQDLCREYSGQLSYDHSGKISYKDFLVMIARVIAQPPSL